MTMLLLLLALQDAPELQKIPFPDPRVAVSGLPWFAEDAPVLRRLPARMKDALRPPVWSLAQHPSGGRLRFRTDSTRVGLLAQSPDPSAMHHMPSVGQNGFDCYADGEYVNSAWPDKTGKIEKLWTVGRDRALRDVTLYLPLYKAVSIQELRLDPGAKLEAPSAFSIPKPVVHYGSSITQGGCASNAGLSVQAILGRRLNTDFVNLGFSGNGMGEPALAEALAEIDAACYVLDYWGNPSPDVYQATLPPFVDLLRRKRPEVPILVIGPFWFPAESLGGGVADAQQRKRAIGKAFVEQRRTAGDARIAWVDGLEMLNREQAVGLVDGVHANSLGFWFCANGLEPHLRRALGMLK
jgi:hypothetical protein